jgi:hypothetical protein
MWDEIVSQSIDEFLKKNPYHQFIALTGGGHLAHASDIPKRTSRRNALDYAIILGDDPIETGIADFVLIPGPVTITPAPRIMTILKEENGRPIFYSSKKIR